VGSFNVLLVLKVPKISTQAHFTLGVKGKVELELNIPIGAITEISPKGFTLGVKAIYIYINLPLYGPNLPQLQPLGPMFLFQKIVVVMKFTP
jgi:hypothetical protein